MRQPGHVQPCSRTGGKASRILNWIPSSLPPSLAIPTLESSANGWNAPGPRPDRLGPPHGPPSTSVADFFPAASRAEQRDGPHWISSRGQMPGPSLGNWISLAESKPEPGQPGKQNRPCYGISMPAGSSLPPRLPELISAFSVSMRNTLWLRVLSPQTRRFSPSSGRGKMRAFFQRP